MSNLGRAIAKLSRRQKLAVATMILFITLTWLAVCAILASYLVG